MILPQPSAICPQFAPACWQVRGVHAGAPHVPFTHGVFAGHGQLLMPPHPFATGPQTDPGAGAGHAVGVHCAVPHMFGPPPPQI